jgi:hypothetical protein
MELRSQLQRRSIMAVISAAALILGVVLIAPHVTAATSNDGVPANGGYTASG